MPAPAVCSAVVGRADIGRLLAADSFLDADSPAQAARFSNISAACNYSSWEPEPDANNLRHLPQQCWAALGAYESAEDVRLSHFPPALFSLRIGEGSGCSGAMRVCVAQDRPYLYAVLTQCCAVFALLLGMVTAVCDLGLLNSIDVSLVGAEAITVVLGLCESAFGVWVAVDAPSHNLGLILLGLGATNIALGLCSVITFCPRRAARFRFSGASSDSRLPAPMDPDAFAGRLRRLRFGLAVHMLL